MHPSQPTPTHRPPETESPSSQLDATAAQSPLVSPAHTPDLTLLSGPRAVSGRQYWANRLSLRLRVGLLLLAALVVALVAVVVPGLSVGRTDTLWGLATGLVLSAVLLGVTKRTSV